MSLKNKRILVIIGGGIAAYKVLELIRRLKDAGASVRAVMTGSAHHFVTPLSVSAITGERVTTDLFDPQEGHQVDHIRLSRAADLVVVAPATADLLAKMAHGLAGDLASAVLLASNKPVLAAPAMNPLMWAHPATQRNVATLLGDGVQMVGPEAGEMAEAGEAGLGRMAEPAAILAAVDAVFAQKAGPLAGLSAIVTSGPTQEPIDPVRYIANRSSGRQGHAIAAALAKAGAAVTLVSGPVTLAPPPGVRLVSVMTARQMQEAVDAALPADIAVLAAAVADWRTEEDGQKIKKTGDGVPSIVLVENPDILAGLARHRRRPRLLIGFAAETENVLANARAKLQRKGCDWLVANDVSPETGIMGGERNRVQLVTPDNVEDWPEMPKNAVAEKLVARIAGHFDAAPALRPTPEPKPAEPMPKAPAAAADAPAIDRKDKPRGRDDNAPMPRSLDIRPTR